MKTLKRFFIERRPFKGHLDLYFSEEVDGKVHTFESVMVKEISQAEIPPSFLTLTTEEATMFMDELWHAGIRPSNGEGSSGQLSATENHLKDLRKLLFKQLEIKE